MRSIRYFQTKEFVDRIPSDLTPLNFFDYTYERVKEHLETLSSNPKVKKIVLGIHHVPSSEFIVYGRNARYDYLNFFMGSDKLLQLYENPKVLLKLTGHTHRNDKHHEIQNISSTEENPFYVFDI